jgi:hypothetical protein
MQRLRRRGHSSVKGSASTPRNIGLPAARKAASSRAAYRPDLAYIHDTGFSGFVSSALPSLFGILHTAGIRKGLVVDVGCRTGVLARRDVQGGLAPSDGIARLPSRDGDRRMFELCIRQKRRRGRAGALVSTRLRALEPGGVLVFDIAEPGQVRGKTDSKRHAQGTDWAVLVDLEESAIPHACGGR